MIDRENLTPAPWRRKSKTADVQECIDEDPLTVAKCHSSTFAPHPRVAWANAEFIALARNWLDCQERRGWYVVPHRLKYTRGWSVRDRGGWPVDGDICHNDAIEAWQWAVDYDAELRRAEKGGA